MREKLVHNNKKLIEYSFILQEMTISKEEEKNSTLIISSESLICNENNFYDTLIQNGVAVIPLQITKDDRNKSLEDTKFYNSINDIFTSSFNIKEPTLDEKLNPKKINNKAPDSSQGWIHQYATPIHNLVQMDPVYRSIIKKLYGFTDETIKHKPNRIRYCTNYKRSLKTLHFDGKPFLKNDDGKIILDTQPLISTIIGLSGTRRFVWWDIKDQPLETIYNYWKVKGSKNFTEIDAEFMFQNYPNCRRLVDIDCSESIYMIAFRENIPHEISNSPNLSLYLSPVYDYNTSKNSNISTCQVLEFQNLTQHETDLIGICYQMGGSHWPSGKKLYQSYHTRAYSHYIPKTDSYFLENNTHQMKLIRNGQINQKTSEYKKKLDNLNIKLPSIVFEETTPNFVVDITEFPIQILKDYGFIKGV